MEVDKQQYLESFLHIAKNAKSKNEFLKNVQEFDHKFTQTFQGPTYQNKALFESFNSISQAQVPQKLKNPFINQVPQNPRNNQRNYSPSRSNNFINMPNMPSGYPNMPSGYPGNNSNNLLTNNQNKMNIPFSRSEQQFFKQQPISNTFHGGFGNKQYEKPQQLKEFNQFKGKNGNYQWQMNEGYNQSPLPYNFQQYAKQHYNQMLKNYANFNLNEPKKYINPNQLSINSHQNFTPVGSNIDFHPNQFLAGLNRGEQPFAKYYNRLIPNQNKAEIPNPRSQMGMGLGNRMNPFANQ